MTNNLALLGLRIGLGIVFFFFGFDKLPHPEHWIIYLPSYLGSIPLSTHQFLRLQGIMECILGIHFFAGFFTRFVAFFSTCVLGLIIYTIGLDHAGIRDVGLFFASFSLGLLGPGNWSLDAKLKHS